MHSKFFPRPKPELKYAGTKYTGLILALISTLLIISASCATLKPTPQPYKTSLSFKGQYYQVVYNDFLNLFRRKGIKIISESWEQGLIETDWLYFSRPGSNWRFRYSLVLSFAKDNEQPNSIQISATARYQRGILLRQDPFTPNPIGYDWDDLAPDQFLIGNINDFFISLKNHIDPIQSNIILPYPQGIRRVIYRIKGISIEKVKSFPFDETQRIFNLGDEYVDIQTSSQIFSENDAVIFPIADERFSQFLSSTGFCQSDDLMIKEKARKIIGTEKNSWRAVKMIVTWLKKEITPAYNFSFSEAKDVLLSLQGDCTEYTVLAAAFCRAVGIPARAVVGIMYDGGIFNYHMWLEAYVGQWVSIDPQFYEIDEDSGEYYTDATHLKFLQINLGDDTLKVMNQFMGSIMDNLELEILDYGVGPGQVIDN